MTRSMTRFFSYTLINQQNTLSKLIVLDKVSKGGQHRKPSMEKGARRGQLHGQSIIDLQCIMLNVSMVIHDCAEIKACHLKLYKDLYRYMNKNQFSLA